jgi:hypothetical protein
MLLALGLVGVPIYLSPEWPSENLVMKTNNLNVSAIVLDTAVNVMITAMISIRIISIYRMTNNSIQVHAKKYLNIVAMLVESAAPCAILGIIFCANELVGDGSYSSMFVYCDGAIYQTWAMSIVSSLFYSKRQNN